MHTLSLSDNPAIELSPARRFLPRVIDGDPVLMDQSHRLRYQVYCVERRFLRAEEYPDQLERDEFDASSVHVGAVDCHGQLAGTARLVKPTHAGLPLFRHCTLFPDITLFNDPSNLVVEVSRVSISRTYSRRQGRPVSGAAAAGEAPLSPVTAGAERRRHSYEPFLTLLEAVIRGARRAGATHLIGATDAALHRWLVHLGFPYRLAGPEVDYYGIIAPHVMSLDELDQVILGRRFPALEGFPVGPDAGASGDR